MPELRRSFGEVVAVGGLSRSVTAGCLFGFVGCNGASKPNTMQIVCGPLRIGAPVMLPRVLARRRSGSGAPR